MEDGLVFARYLDEAAEGFFRLMLGRRVGEIVATAFTRPDNGYSYENVTFAEREGVVVGAVSGYTSERYRGFADRPLEEAAGGRAFRLKCVKRLLAPMWRILESLEDGDFYLQTIAVDKELRGEGVGSLLMDHIERLAVEGGAERFSLDVSARNSGARGLYERRGMSVSSEWPASPLVPSMLVRMTKSLQATK